MEFLFTVPGMIVAAIVGLLIGGILAVLAAKFNKWPFNKAPQINGGFQVQSALVATLLAGLVFFGIFQDMPTISIDISIIFSYASQIVNMMMPIVGVGAGISFGFALVAYIIRLFRQVF